MKNKAKHNKFLWSFGLVAFLLINLLFIVSKFGIVSSDTEMVSSDDVTLEKIYNSLNEVSEKDPSIALSSNPYDFMVENDYYHTIVSKGVAVLPRLEELLLSSEEDGLVQYVLAAAIEEISGTSVQYILYGKTEKSWSTPEEFAIQWQESCEVAQEKVRNVLDSNKSLNLKLEEIKEYGVLASPVLIEYEKKPDKELPIEIKEYSVTLGLTKDEVEIVNTIEK